MKKYKNGKIILENDNYTLTDKQSEYDQDYHLFDHKENQHYYIDKHYINEQLKTIQMSIKQYVTKYGFQNLKVFSYIIR